MPVLPVDPGGPDEAIVGRAVGALTRGGLIVFPTETFYGLGADPFREEAIEALVSAKGRPAGMPILLLLSGMDQALQAAESLPPGFGALGARLWPGPLTLVVAARADLPDALTAGTGTIGLRVPGHAVPRALARGLGRPITGTSANLSGQPPPRTAGELRAALGPGLDRVDLVLDGGPTPGGAPSTVVDLTSGEPRLVRAGAVPFELVLETLRQSPA